MDPHSMGMQSSMSMPMSMGMNGNPQAMGGMNAMYSQQPQMMMNQQMPMQMNPQTSSADWRIQLTREHRANLIAKIYNEMVRVSADPVPGIKLWMNVSWYELSLYKESPTQEVYINKIFTRLKSLRAQQSDMNAAMAAQALPNQGMLSRLDFSYYNTLSLSQRGANPGQVSSYPGHSQFGGPGQHPGTQQQQHQQQQQQQQQQHGNGTTPIKAETNMTSSSNSVDEYWRQHAALRAKHQGDVEKVHSAFKKYVDHMKGHDETEQKKKLRYLLSYVELCANILGEDKVTHPPRKLEELDKVFKYIVKIVNPYLKKLRTETDKRSYPSDSTSSSAVIGGQPNTSVAPEAPTPSGAPTSSGSSTGMTNTSNGFSATTQQQSAPDAQNQQQQYIMQQRTQHMQHQHQQQQRMHQQQMIQHQQMQQKAPQQQTQFPAQQGSQMKQQQNSQNAANQQSGQQTQQPVRSQQTAAQPPQKPPQSQQVPSSRGESPSFSSGLSIGVDDSLYGSMSNDLLQMPTPSGTSSGLMDFSSALSPTSFGGMDLMDWDDGTPRHSTSGQSNASGGDSSDLLMFVETL